MDNTGHDIIHLFNEVLLEKEDLISIIQENNVASLSQKTPGLIIQAYLVLVEIFNLDVMEPLKRESLTVKQEVEGLDTGIIFEEVGESGDQSFTKDELIVENVLQEDLGTVKFYLASKIAYDLGRTKISKSGQVK